MSHEPDSLRRFLIESASVRGVIVRLDQVWAEIQSRAEYPPAVAHVLGELMVASVLFAGDIKFAGTVSVQLRSSSNLELGFAECSNEGHVRGLMRWKEPIPAHYRVADFGEGAILAITIERENGQRYQGMVPLEGETLGDAFEQYFAQSEQLPTAIRMAVTPDCTAGMLIQQIALEGGVVHDDKDSEASETTRQSEKQHAFEELAILFRTLSAEELLNLESVTILQRLFAEHDIRVMNSQTMRFRCRCSREKVASVLKQIGHDEAFAAVQTDGAAEITCEFCNQRYRFDRIDLGVLFSESTVVDANLRQQ